MSSRSPHAVWCALALFCGLLLCAAQASAQGVDVANRPVSDVRVEGLTQSPPQLVLNQVRLNKGDPYNADVVAQDIVRITHLGRFSSVRARVEPQPDGSVVVVYVVDEQAVLSDVQVVGNKQLSDQELLGLVVLRAGDPIDPFLIERGVREIKAAYEKAGYFVSDVSVDNELLKEQNILVYRVREGPRVRIRGLAFEGNTVFSDKELRSRIQSNTYMFIFRKGELSREVLEADAARIRDFYREAGFLDAQVGRRIDLSPDQKDAVVVFFIDEGRQYTVSSIRVEGNELFSAAQVLDAMPLKVGDVFSDTKVKASLEALLDLYGKLGFIETRINIDRLFHEKDPRVDVAVRITEGAPYLVGKITVRGNELTKDKVVLRQLRGMNPGERFDREGIQRTERRLGESALFSDASVTVLGQPEDTYRDVLVEVKERNTGSLSFGAGVSSDLGVLGAIELTQRNFDIADWPESFGEFVSGRAFRGAGQYFNLALQPGDEYSRYGISFREPYLLDSDYFLDTNVFFFTREREDYDEERFGGRVGIGQRFGDVWSAQVFTRAEQVGIDDIEPSAPVDVFAVQGDSFLTALGISISRNTTDSRVFPTRGSNLTLGLSRIGALGGDYDFTRASVDFKKFWTVDEDFFGRRTVLSMRVEAGYIFEEDEAPVFERHYAGGHRSFRGFDYRGVGPRGVRNDLLPAQVLGDDPVGGDWLFLLGFEYNFPIFGQPGPNERAGLLNGVVFIDTGTVQKEIGFDEYRVAIGAGIRLRIPFLGQAPFALDFAFPILEEETDETRLFSFDLAVPF